MNDETREGSLLLINPETTNSEGDVKLNSTGKVSSGVSLTLSNNKLKILPHYLRASTGSCHDFCKYGRKHTFESKGKRPTLRRFSCGSVDTEKGQSKVKGLNVAEKQKKTAKQNASANQKNELSDRPEVFVERALSSVDIVEGTDTQIVVGYTENHIVNHNSFFPEKRNSSQSSETIECNSPLPFEKIVPLDGFETINADTPLERIMLHDDPETISHKTIAETPKYPETTDKKKPSGKKKHLSLGPASVEQRTQSSKRLSASVKPDIRQTAQSPVKASISASLPRISKKETLFSKKLDAPVGSAMSGKSRITTLKSISPKNPTAGTARRKNENKGVKNVELSKSLQKKTPKPPSSSLSSPSPLDQDSNSTRSADPAEHPRIVEKAQLDFDQIQEKTLYIIELRQTEDRNFRSAGSKASSCQLSRSSSSSSLSSILLSSPSVSDFKQDANQEVESALVEPCSISEHVGARANKGQSQRRMATAHEGDEDPTPYKLKFRRGKVVYPQSDNNGARRLTFKEGMKLGDAQSGKREIEKRSFRRKQLAGDQNRPDPEAKTVVLRHQDMQDKKDAPDLLNQIIEETASKLVKTRKSKVKALVGAFETVISLRDSKPAASV